MKLEQALRANRSGLIGDWDRLKQSSWRAKALILEIYDTSGYSAAMAAKDDVQNCEYEKLKKEAKWRAV